MATTRVSSGADRLRDKGINVRVTPEEKTAIESAAARESEYATVGVWARTILLRAAGVEASPRRTKSKGKRAAA
jgi:uncharacterized protein (DUF1778 family)